MHKLGKYMHTQKRSKKNKDGQASIGNLFHAEDIHVLHILKIHIVLERTRLVSLVC